jgi:glutathione synthase/RimK-type ligase-like ATP-grasp enzyme
MLLVLTEPADVHADHLIDKLRARAADVVRFNPADYPARAEISLTYSAAGQVNASLRADGQQIDFREVSAVWWRRPRAPRAHADIVEPRTRTYVEQESKSFTQDAWTFLDCPWLPARPNVVHQAGQKAAQLRVAAELGFELPPTLMTNSPADFLEFYRQHNGGIISKLASGAFFQSLGTTYSRYTEVVSKRDVGYARAVQYCPTIFQAYVAKRLELRVTVVGQRVFAAEIHSQESNHTRYDWRRYDHFTTIHRPHQLPDDLRLRCVRLVEHFGLRYGAIDLILTPDGRYVFLELNPNGQYLWIEDATELPISDAIVDELLSSRAASRAA